MLRPCLCLLSRRPVLQLPPKRLPMTEAAERITALLTRSGIAVKRARLTDGGTGTFVFHGEGTARKAMILLGKAFDVEGPSKETTAAAGEDWWSRNVVTEWHVWIMGPKS